MDEKKMNVGKLCLDNCANYGNVLQSYALQEVLEKFNVSVDCLWHIKILEHPITAIEPWNWKSYIKFLINWKNFRDNIISCRTAWEVSRMETIYRFCMNRLHIRKLMGENLSNIVDEYDAFIVGSDQVWNPNFFFGYENNLLLTFAPKEKKISYAASIGIQEIPSKWKNFYKKNLKDFPFISVRERDGACLIKNLIGRDVPVHLDPTLLLTASEWAAIEECPPWLNEQKKGYVLTYFLGKKQKVADEVAESLGLPIIHLLDMSDFDQYVTSPEEFIYLIHHAALIYTDSFHGTVFSIHFHRPFVVCNRVQKGCEQMNSRIDTLLEMFAIEGRRGTKENNYCVENPLVMDFPDLEPTLEYERARSKDYLMKALSSVLGKNISQDWSDNYAL